MTQGPRPEPDPPVTTSESPIEVTLGPPHLAPPAPPTTRDGSLADTHPPATTRDGSPADTRPPATTRDAGAGICAHRTAPADDTGLAAGFSRVNLPPPLAARLTRILDLPATGGEADLVLCRRNEDGEQVVVKLYRQARANLDRSAFALLEQTDHDHVVVVHAYGHFQGLWWEVQEYLEQGSLLELMEREGPALPLPLLQEILDELVPALEHLHDLGIVHRDVKPSNVLIRRRRKLNLVLADFGLAVVLAATREMRSGSRTSAYAAPEAAWGDTSVSRDWWSLGITLLELGTGGHPFRAPDGRWLEDAQINALLATKPIDVSAMPDARWRHLLTGLLIRDPARRWGRAEVDRWRRGELPPLYEEHPTPEQAEPDGPAFTFRGEDHHDLESLAAHFATEWNATAELILGRGLADLRAWVEEVDGSQAVTRALRGCQERRLPVDRLVAKLVLAMAPGLEPTFRGFSVLPGRLPALARDAMAGPGRARDAVDALRTSGSLAVYAAIPDCPDHAHLAEHWQQLFQETERICTEGGVPREVVDGIRPLAGPMLLNVLTDVAARDELARRAAAARRNPPPAVAWFASLARVTPAPDLVHARNLALVAARSVADDQQREHDDRQRLERERLQAEERERRRTQRQDAAARRRQERDRAAGPRLRRERTLIGWVIFLLVTAAGPWYLGRIWTEHRVVVGLPWWDSSQPVSPVGAWVVALHSSYEFAIRYAFGAAVLLGLLGAALLLPPWGGRRPLRLAVAAVMFAALPAAPNVSSFVAERYTDAAATSYRVGPVPTTAIAPVTCGTVWTSNDPVAGAYRRYVLAGTAGTSQCTVLVGYAGWRRHLRVNAPRQGFFVSLASYPGMLVTRVDIAGSANQLWGVDQTTGRVKWHFVCPDRKASYLQGEVYSGADGLPAGSQRYVEVTCLKGVVKVSPLNGKILD